MSVEITIEKIAETGSDLLRVEAPFLDGDRFYFGARSTVDVGILSDQGWWYQPGRRLPDLPDTAVISIGIHDVVAGSLLIVASPNGMPTRYYKSLGGTLTPLVTELSDGLGPRPVLTSGTLLSGDAVFGLAPDSFVDRSIWLKKLVRYTDINAFQFVADQTTGLPGGATVGLVGNPIAAGGSLVYPAGASFRLEFILRSGVPLVRGVDPLPGGSEGETFVSFGPDVAYDGSTVVFIRDRAPRGIYLKRSDGTIETIADWDTPAPGMPGFFMRRFSRPSIHDGNFGVHRESVLGARISHGTVRRDRGRIGEARSPRGSTGR